MFENPRRGRQAKNFTTNVRDKRTPTDVCGEATENSRSQIVFRTDIFRKLSLGAPDKNQVHESINILSVIHERVSRGPNLQLFLK